MKNAFGWNDFRALTNFGFYQWHLGRDRLNLVFTRHDGPREVPGMNSARQMLFLWGGAALLTTHGAYAAPPVPVRQLELGA